VEILGQVDQAIIYYRYEPTGAAKNSLINRKEFDEGSFFISTFLLVSVVFKYGTCSFFGIV
jgi:hypothetical protein